MAQMPYECKHGSKERVSEIFKRGEQQFWKGLVGK
jgi:hypothetical protein